MMPTERQQRAQNMFLYRPNYAYLEYNDIGRWIYREWADGDITERGYVNNNVLIFQYDKIITHKRSNFIFMNVIEK